MGFPEKISNAITTTLIPAEFGKFVGAGLATLCFLGVSISLGMIGVAWLKSIQRQPEATGKLFTPAILAMALVESIGLFAMVVAILIVMN